MAFYEVKKVEEPGQYVEVHELPMHSIFTTRSGRYGIRLWDGAIMQDGVGDWIAYSNKDAGMKLHAKRVPAGTQIIFTEEGET